MADLVSSTCNECGAEVLVNRETDNYRFGRIYCEEHSVLRPLWGHTLTGRRAAFQAVECGFEAR